MLPTLRKALILPRHFALGEKYSHVPIEKLDV